MGEKAMAENNKIYRQLIEKRKELESRINKIKHDYSTPLEKDSEEQATQLENAEVLNVIDEEARDELAQIDKALGLIERGEYGTCIVCEGKIPEKRLAALPHTSYCVDCAEKQ